VSKARLVITAVVVEGRPQHEVARAYGLSQSRVSRLVARFRREGEAAFEPRSRRPNRSPAAIPQATVELVCQLRRDLTSQGLEAGPDIIAWYLDQHHGISVSAEPASGWGSFDQDWNPVSPGCLLTGPPEAGTLVGDGDA
jgi:transposase